MFRWHSQSAWNPLIEIGNLVSILLDPKLWPLINNFQVKSDFVFLIIKGVNHGVRPLIMI